MALIDPFIPDDTMKYDANANFSVEDACEEITAEVVKKYPKLVAEIESGVSSRTILESKIREIVINKRIYHGSIEAFMQKIFDTLFGY